MKTKYSKAETNVETIQSALEKHQVQLLKDIAMLDKMYELNMAYFKELSMYILAGKKKLADFRAHEPQQAMTRQRLPACLRTHRPHAIWPTSASALRKSSTTLS